MIQLVLQVALAAVQLTKAVVENLSKPAPNPAPEVTPPPEPSNSEVLRQLRRIQARRRQ